MLRSGSSVHQLRNQAYEEKCHVSDGETLPPAGQLLPGLRHTGQNPRTQLCFHLARGDVQTSPRGWYHLQKRKSTGMENVEDQLDSFGSEQDPTGLARKSR
nr:PREDICTED: uncharacterized protein LOC102694444 isoform X2 [Lepisosteus oculatus]